MAEQDTMRAQQAVEAVLSHRAANEPGFVERVMMDPNGVVGPIVAEVLEDDGDLDLDGVGINVHVQTPKSLHFVMSTDDEDEVSGFARFGRESIPTMLSFDVVAPRFQLGTLANTQMEPASTNGDDDAKCKPSTL